MNYTDSHQTGPSLRIFATAFVVGSISFAIGFIGPILFSDSNLGPLIGIFVTGPVGTLVGALIGIVRSALHAGERSIRTELWWLGSIWGLSLFYSIWGGMGIVTLGLQGLVVALGAFLLGNRKVRRNLTEPARKYGTVLLCVAVLIVLTSMFPPVTQPWWVSEQARNRVSASEPLPMFAFFMDSRFDASKQIPKFAVAKGELVSEWFVIAAVAGLVILFIAVRSKRSNMRPKG